VHENSDVTSFSTPSTSKTAGNYNNDPIIPSPFKRALFWPQQRSEPTLKRKREKVPSVATSEEWKKYHEKKRKEKERIQEEKKERQRKREIAKKTKGAKKIKGRSKRKISLSSTESSDSSIELRLESEGDGEDWLQETMSNSEDESQASVKTNDYVIVQYEGEFFPGRVLETMQKAAFVKVMLMSGCGWNWPEVDDMLWYDYEDILEVINIPKYDKKKQIYLVEEMDKYHVK
jgi:hypothetical protein